MLAGVIEQVLLFRRARLSRCVSNNSGNSESDTNVVATRLLPTIKHNAQPGRGHPNTAGLHARHSGSGCFCATCSDFGYRAGFILTTYYRRLFGTSSLMGDVISQSLLHAARVVLEPSRQFRSRRGPNFCGVPQ